MNRLLLFVLGALAFNGLVGAMPYESGYLPSLPSLPSFPTPPAFPNPTYQSTNSYGGHKQQYEDEDLTVVIDNDNDNNNYNENQEINFSGAGQENIAANANLNYVNQKAVSKVDASAPAQSSYGDQSYGNSGQSANYGYAQKQPSYSEPKANYQTSYVSSSSYSNNEQSYGYQPNYDNGGYNGDNYDKSYKKPKKAKKNKYPKGYEVSQQYQSYSPVPVVPYNIPADIVNWQAYQWLPQAVGYGYPYRPTPYWPVSAYQPGPYPVAGPYPQPAPYPAQPTPYQGAPLPCPPGMAQYSAAPVSYPAPAPYPIPAPIY